MRIRLRVAMVLATVAIMPTMAMASPADLVAPTPPLPVGHATPMESKLSPDFRVRSDTLTTSARLDPFGDPAGPMRRRIASSMFEYYPLGGSGLHLSAGLRLFAVANFLRDAEKATGGLLYSPRLAGSGSGVRTGFNRHTPAATLGYTGSYRKAVFGVEMGSLIGSANANLPRSMEMLSNRSRGGVNPIANLMVGLRF